MKRILPDDKKSEIFLKKLPKIWIVAERDYLFALHCIVGAWKDILVDDKVGATSKMPLLWTYNYKTKQYELLEPEEFVNLNQKQTGKLYGWFTTKEEALQYVIDKYNKEIEETDKKAKSKIK